MKVFASIFLVALILPFALGQQPATTPPPAFELPSMQQVLYTPITALPEFADAEIAIINHSQIQESATLTIYSLDGKPSATKSISLLPGETQRYKIRQFMADSADAVLSLGGMTVEYYAPPMVVAAQITLEGYASGGNLDYLLEDAMEFRSSSFDAVWWQQAAGSSCAIIGNASDQTVPVNLDDDKSFRVHMVLKPYQTVVQKLEEYTQPSLNAPGHIRSLHVQTPAKSGTIRATGFSASPNGYFENIRFFDPGSIHESVLYANGLHFSSENHLLVKNIGEQPASISAALMPLDRNLAKNPPSIPAITIQPSEAAELDLPLQLGRQLEGSALKVETSGRAGSVIAAFASFDPQARLTRYTPFKDVWDLSVSTGGYPWRLDGDYESRVYITNVSNVRSPIGVVIRPEGGKDYQPKTQSLEPGETAVFDLRHIRDMQIPDEKGVTLPRDVLLGNLEWSMVGDQGEQRFIGRNVVESRSAGVSSSFSCAACNCPWNRSRAWIDPNDPITGVESTTYIDGVVVYTNPCGGDQRQYSFDASGWQIASPAIFSLTTPNPFVMRGLAPGSSSFYAPMDNTNYQFNGQYCFQAPTSPINPGGTGAVPSITLTCDKLDLSLGTSAPASTVTGNCTAQAMPTGGTFSWSKNRNTITLTPSQNGSSATYTSASASGIAGDTTIFVTYTYTANTQQKQVTSTSQPITVHKPTSLSASQVAPAGTATCTLPCLAAPGDGTCNVKLGTQCSYAANQFQREYKVNDQFGVFFQNFGINDAVVTENVQIVSSNCGGNNIGTGSSAFTDFFDTFGKCDSCCETGGPGCTTTASQNISVNGFVVRNTTITTSCSTASVTP